MKLLLDLFIIFARIGGFTFGGGYAMLPMLQKEVVENRKWATQDELMDYYAIGQCTPGIIAVNVATFIGTKLKGFPGALFATMGVITPSIIIIAVIAAFISGFQDIEIVTHAFGGIRAAVVALILSSVIKLSKKSIVDKITTVIFLLVAVLAFFTDISPVLFIVAVAFISLVINMLKAKKMKRGRRKMIFLQLFFRFFCVGLFSVGGGLATLPFLTDMAETTGWFTQTDISDMIAISESTPGPIGINMATYVGYQTGADLGSFGGLIGALVAPLGLTAPALIIIVIISKVLQKFRSSKYVEWVFYGLRAASLGLIASACLGVAKIAFFSADVFAESGNFLMAVDYKSIILSVLVFLGISKFKKVHPIVFILIAALVGVVFKF